VLVVSRDRAAGARWQFRQAEHGQQFTAVARIASVFRDSSGGLALLDDFRS
jgi:hypothetical protein